MTEKSLSDGDDDVNAGCGEGGERSDEGEMGEGAREEGVKGEREEEEGETREGERGASDFFFFLVLVRLFANQ